MLGQGTLEVVGDGPDGGGVSISLQRYGNTPSDTRAKASMYFLRESSGQLGEELELGRDVPRSDISKEKYPEAHAKVIRLMKSRIGSLEDGTSKWPKMYHDLIDSIDPVQLFDLHQFPFDAKIRDDHELPLVCIGDALHAMSPTSGSGGNLACKDANELATYLIEASATNPDGLVGGLVKLQEGFLQRMEEKQKLGEWNAERKKSVLLRKEAVDKYYNNTTPWEGVDDVFGWGTSFVMGRLFYWIHKMEGFGLKDSS